MPFKDWLDTVHLAPSVLHSVIARSGEVKHDFGSFGQQVVTLDYYRPMFVRLLLTVSPQILLILEQ